MEDIITLLQVFAPLFSQRVWMQAQWLLLGALLAPGKRTVTAILRVLGRSQEGHFTNFHRVLNRAQWSARQGSRLLLGLLVATFVPAGAPLVLGADDTVERRGGQKIKAVGCYRDAVRSTHKHVVRCFGLKWVSMMLLVPVPWSGRVWALPFLTALCAPADQDDTPAPAAGGGKKKRSKAKKKKPRRTQRHHFYREASGHKTNVDWVRQLLKQVHRWAPTRRLILIVDGGLVSIGLGLSCLWLGATLVSRLRWDAQLYHPAGTPPPSKCGRKAHKGQRQRGLKEWAQRRDTPWVPTRLRWYGGKRKTMLLFSQTALWYTPSWEPLPIRFVLVRDPQGHLRDEVFFCTDLQAAPAQILQWVIQRWSVETTFEEARAHLGMETQRQWSDRAIQRTTPVLLGLYALVPWLAFRLTQSADLPCQYTAWYHKPQATFSDCLWLVRKHIWQQQIQHYVISSSDPDLTQFTPEILDLLLLLEYPNVA